MTTTLPSLTTPDARAGLALAEKLAGQLDSQMEQARAKVERPGGMNYALPEPVPKEITASILFYAIAAANRGWTNKA